MSKYYRRPTPGEKITYDGEDFYAIKRLDGQLCTPCAFDVEEELPSRCGKSECLGVAWVPLKVYITHRLMT